MSSAETSSISEPDDDFFANWIASWACKVAIANNKNMAAATRPVQAPPAAQPEGKLSSSPSRTRFPA